MVGECKVGGSVCRAPLPGPEGPGLASSLGEGNESD